MELHSFQKSLKVGKEGESKLDEHFSNKFDITEVDLNVEFHGIDRIFTHKKTGSKCAVEYKTDVREGTTGNVFIETWSNKESGKKGWIFTSLAQWLYFYLPSSSEACIIEMTQIKILLPKIEKEYAVKKAFNKSSKGFYTSEGIVVPSVKFKEWCHEVIRV